MSRSATLERVAQYYEGQLWHGALGAAGRQLLLARGVPLEQARAWRLGLAPAGSTLMTEALARQGVTREELCAAGLARADGRAGYFELLRGRLVFPYTASGRVVGFSGRLLPGSRSSCKYLCSSGPFSPSQDPFGLDEARQALAAGQPAVVVEGPFDAMALHRAGVASAVAVSGVALNGAVVEHLLAASSKGVVSLFDGDAAGAEAAARAARDALLRPGLPLSIALCPTGLDPDQVVAQEGGDGIRSRLAAALSAADFLVTRIPELSDRASPELVVRTLAEFISQFPSGFAFSERQVDVVASRLSIRPGLVAEYLLDQARARGAEQAPGAAGTRLTDRSRGRRKTPVLPRVRQRVAGLER
jgi:DNA primase catalytic core